MTIHAAAFTVVCSGCRTNLEHGILGHVPQLDQRHDAVRYATNEPRPLTQLPRSASCSTAQHSILTSDKRAFQVCLAVVADRLQRVVARDEDRGGHGVKRATARAAQRSAAVRADVPCPRWDEFGKRRPARLTGLKSAPSQTTVDGTD